MFLDDFIIYNDTENHLMKLRLCFQKCKEYKINLNLEKCAFMVFLGLILRFIVFKEGKILDPKKVQAIVNMLVPTNPQQIQLFNGMVQFYICFIKNFSLIMAPITKLMRKTKPFIWTIKCQETWGLYQVKVHGNIDFNTSKLAVGVSHAHKHIIVGSRCNVGTKPNW